MRFGQRLGRNETWITNVVNGVVNVEVRVSETRNAAEPAFRLAKQRARKPNPYFALFAVHQISW